MKLTIDGLGPAPEKVYLRKSYKTYGAKLELVDVASCKDGDVCLEYTLVGEVTMRTQIVPSTTYIPEEYDSTNEA